MRLLFVNSAWAESWGGGEKWTIEAAHWFREHGHSTQVVGRPNSRLRKVAESRRLDFVETTFGGDFSPAALWRAKGLIKSFRGDLVMVNFNKEAWQFGIAAKMMRVPLIARHGFPLLRDSAHHRFLLTRLLSELVVNAASIREHYRKLGLPVDAVDVVHNGTAILPQKRGDLRQRYGIGEGEPLVLAAGRLEPQKRLDRVVEMAAVLLPQFPNLRFLIAGDGPLRDNLVEQIRTLGLERRVQLAGFVPDFAEVAGDADLFLLTSDDEGTPNVLIEAMAAGTACLAFGVGAVPEILHGALAENVLPPGDVSAMIQRAALLLGDSEARGQIASQMRIRAFQEFSIDASMKRFEEIFQKTIVKIA